MGEVRGFLSMGGRACCTQMCICALDVGGLVLTPTYICLAVCDLESGGGGVNLGDGVCRRNGWKCVGGEVGAPKRARRRESREGVVLAPVLPAHPAESVF